MEQMTAEKLARQIMDRQEGHGSFKQTRWLQSLIIHFETEGGTVQSCQNGTHYLEAFLCGNEWIMVDISKRSGTSKIRTMEK